MNSIVPLIALFFSCGLLLIVLGFFAFTLLYGRRVNRQISGVWQEAAAATGLTRLDNGRNGRPMMQGLVNGVTVTVDIHTQQHLHAKPDRTYRSQMPWTRVQAALPYATHVVARPRDGGVGPKPQLPVQPTGDADFDTQYILYAPENIDLERALPTAVRQALLTTRPAVQLENDRVLWAKVRHVRDARLLIGAIAGCARVTAVFGR